MKHFFRFILFVFLILFTVCCKKKEQEKVSESDKKEVVQSKFAQNYPDFNSNLLKERLQVEVQNDSILQSFYQVSGYTPLWIHDTLDTKKLYELVDILSCAGEHGLAVELFFAEKIKSMTDSIDSMLFANNMDTVYKKISILEQISTKAAITYITGMKYGFLNPKELYHKKEYDLSILVPDSVYISDLCKEMLQDPIATILSSMPDDAVYAKLHNEYKFLESKKEVGFNKIKSGDATYKIGDKSKHIAEIAERLMITGEYTPDSISTDSLHQHLDEQLLAAINAFRRKNSYLEEKEVGKLTIDALNRPIEYYQAKVHANMERYRWKRAKKRHNKNIEVNVAAAMLVATQKDSLPLIMRTCVGTVGNKTPLLQSDIGYLNLNPTWNVPTSIARKEISVLQKRDSTYIKRHNMKLYKGGKEVDVSSVNWKEVDPSKFGYTVRQNSGNGNALGLVKFMFNNSFSVYLHDTPNKAAFNRKNRAVSHGCIRLQKPFELAFFCTSPTTDVYKDQMYYSVRKEPVSTVGKKLLKEGKLKKIPDIINIDQDNAISLFVDYYTAFIYPDSDEVYYADDTYNYDSIILNALNSKQLMQ